MKSLSANPPPPANAPWWKQSASALTGAFLRRPPLALATATALAGIVAATFAVSAANSDSPAAADNNVAITENAQDQGSDALIADLDRKGGGGQIQNLVMTEATNLAPTMSPDQRTVIVDIQNRLWSLPATGGTAEPLTDPLLEPSRPDFSPRGDLVTFQAYKGGTFHIWTMKPNGKQVRRLTEGHGDDREPHFSPDGTKIAFGSDRAFNGTYDIWTIDVDTGALTQVTNTVQGTGTGDEFEPAWSPDGKEIAFISGQGSTGTRIEAITLATGARRTLVTAPAGSRINSPAYSPDGTRIAYVQFANNISRLLVHNIGTGSNAADVGTQVGTFNDVFPFYPKWLSNDRILYGANGKIRVSNVSGGTANEIAFVATYPMVKPQYPKHKRFNFDSDKNRDVKGIVGPQLSPDGKRIVFQALNQLWLLEIGKKKPTQLTNDLYYKCDPAWSPDGKRIAYSSDKGGTEDLYIMDLASGTETRVAQLPTSAEVSAAWSPDGTKLAYQRQDGSTWTIDLASGNTQQVIAPLFAPSKPSWSKNGKTIAVSALKPYTRRFREGNSEMLTVDLATGNLTYTEFAPFKSTSTRGEDGPVYSPDGASVAFVMDSLLYIRDVDANGVMTGKAKQLNDEVTDAPSWSGDGKTLLYLSNGQLRLISRKGGSPETVPLNLDWQDDGGRSQGVTVVNAGVFWDGRGPNVQTNVDILVVNNRIQSISRHRNGHPIPGANYVDASNLTVIPGMWESHTHEWIEGKFYGARLGRLWLAYGFTSTRSVGDPVYRAAETQESYWSGARVGPRYFKTGEAIDGERVYYNFMRPTMSEDGLYRELTRAATMDYDMVKTYVRLQHEWAVKADIFAHEELGVWAASHYMLPLAAFGQDAQTHVSATSKFGFAYTRSSGGISYQDMRDVYSFPKRFVISTTFNSSLYAEDPTMVDDQRLQVLNVPWDQIALRAKRDAAVSTDQTVSLDSLAKEEDTVRTIRRQGGIVLAGTDSPLDNVATALHLNLRAQVKYGLAPWEALQSATLLPAKAFYLDDDLGTLEPGKLADMTMVSGNPLVDIKAAANVKMVMKDGRVYTVEELMAPFTGRRPTVVGLSGTTQPGPQTRVLPSAAKPDTEQYWWHDMSQWNGDDCGKQH